MQDFLTPDIPYTEARELCVNTLFNGRQDGNLGGVYLQGVLAFPDEFKSPRLTPAFYPSPLDRRVSAILGQIEYFCNNKCHCPTEEEVAELKSQAITQARERKRLAEIEEKLNSKRPKPVPKKHPLPNYRPKSSATDGEWDSSNSKSTPYGLNYRIEQ